MSEDRATPTPVDAPVPAPDDRPDELPHELSDASPSARPGARRGWWRRNVAGLCVAAVCVPSVLGATAWVSARHSSYAAVSFDESRLAAEASATAQNTQVGPVVVERVSADSAEQLNAAPSGTKAYLLAVTMAPQAGASTPACSAVLRESDGERRVFTPANHLSTLSSAERFMNECSPGETEEYTAVFLFLVPDNVSASTVLDVRVATDDSRRFRLLSFDVTLP